MGTSNRMTAKQLGKIAEVFGDLGSDQMQGLLGSGIFSEVAAWPIPELVDLWSLQKVLAGGRMPLARPKIWKEIWVGGLQASELQERFQEDGFYGEHVFNCMESPSFPFLPKRIKMKLVRVTLEDLGFIKEPTTYFLSRRLKELHLRFCPYEVGLHLRLDYKDQPEDDATLFVVVEKTPGVWGGAGESLQLLDRYHGDVFRVRSDYIIEPRDKTEQYRWSMAPDYVFVSDE